MALLSDDRPFNRERAAQETYDYIRSKRLAETESVRPIQPIAMALSDLSNRVSEILEQIAALQQRLEPVMHPCVKPAGDTCGDKVPQCNLANDINYHAARLQSASESLQDIINCLEI